ncbi:MAG: helix-turn-helix domain-containing protein [Methanolobus sp.]
MKRGYRYRIYPDKEQKTLLEQHFGGSFHLQPVTFHQELMYSRFRTNVTEVDLNNNLKSLKELFYPWLKDLIHNLCNRLTRIC